MQPLKGGAVVIILMQLIQPTGLQAAESKPRATSRPRTSIPPSKTNSARTRPTAPTAKATPAPKAPSKNAAKPAAPVKLEPYVPPENFPDLPKFNIKTVDAKGKVVTLQWKQRGQWIWEKTPQLYLLLQLPLGYTLSKLKRASTVLKKNPVWAKGEKDGGDIAAFQIEAPLQTATLEILDAKKQVQEVSVIVETSSEGGIVQMDPTCAEAGMVMSPIGKPKEDEHPLFLVGTCQMINDTQAELTLHFPKTQEIPKHTFRSPREKGTGFHKFFVNKETDISKNEKLPHYKFILRDTNTSDAYRYQIVWGAGSSRKRLSFSAALSTTYLHYTETTNVSTVNLTEFAITAKVGAAYPLYKDALDFGLNFFINALPVYKNVYNGTAELSPAVRFYGINTRFGWRLPIKSQRIAVRLNAGYYFWGMIIPPGPNGEEPTFGIRALGGPQVLLSTKIDPGNGHPFWFYFKFAPISSGFALENIANREIAGGMGYLVSPRTSKWTWSITADISDFKFQPPEFTNQISLFTTSLGLEVGF
ncbi:MAG: hypothetical protein AB7F66_01520 [Bacteriovoracia bacterium]